MTLLVLASLQGFAQLLPPANSGCPYFVDTTHRMVGTDSFRLVYHYNNPTGAKKDVKIIIKSAKTGGITLLDTCMTVKANGPFLDSTRNFKYYSGIYIELNSYPGNSCGGTACWTTVSATPLPVKIVSFDATTRNNSVMLFWQVAEEDIKSYVAERSFDGNEWTGIGNIAPTGSVYYSYTDNVNQNAYYRLKLVEKDDTYSYSQTIMVKIAGTSSIYLFPNPVTEMLQLSSAADYELYDLQGKQILKGTGNSIKMNVPSGTYLLKLENNMHNIIKL